jgi:uncharacterized membrane protein (DUF106 family)
MDIANMIDPIYAIAAISGVYVLISRELMNRFGERDKLKAIQKEQGALNKEFQEAMKSKDDKKIEEINKKYEKFTPKIKEMIILMYKPFIILIPLVIIFPAVAKSVYPEFVIVLPFELPVFVQSFPYLFHLDIDGFINDFPHWRDTFGAVGWFWISVICLSMVFALVKKAYDIVIKGNSPKLDIHGAQTKDSQTEESKKDDENKVGEKDGTSKE